MSFYQQQGQHALSSGVTHKLKPHLATPYNYIFHKLSLNKTHNSNLKLLDLCCGTGQFLTTFHQMNFKVHGVDLSKPSISYAQKAYSKNKDLTLESGDAIGYLKNNNNFKVIFCAGSLYYLPRPLALELLYNSLQSNGEYWGVETNGSNFLMNSFRKIKHRLKNHKDAHTLVGLIKASEMKNWDQYFDKIEIRYFDFLTLFAMFIKIKPLQKAYLSLTRKIDFFLLNTLGLKFLAFKVVIHGQKIETKNI